MLAPSTKIEYNHIKLNKMKLHLIMLPTVSVQVEGVRTRMKPQQMTMIPTSFIPVKTLPL